MRVIPCLMLLLLVSAFAVQSQVRNAELGYSLALPEGFTEFREARAQKDVVDAWSETAPASANGALVLQVARMHGVLPREAMRQEDVPANAQVVSFKWKGFDVSGLKTLTTQAGQGQAIMEATLASLEGETNWLTSAERSGRLGRAAGVWIGIAVAAIAILAWRKRRARAA